jgi:uncharacterized protein (TIGR03067 family)
MKTYTFVALVLIAFGRPTVAATPSEETAKKELEVLQGTWTVAYSEQHGERRNDLEEVKKMRLTIKDDNWTLEYHNNAKDKHVATLKLDPAQKPKAVDFKFSDGLLAGETMLSIYELKGDDLKFCFPSESRQRPTSFDSRAGTAGQWLLVLKREK